MEEYLVVDGYNIIFAWPELERLVECSLEHARVKLIDILINHAALTGVKVMVVFDAHQGKEVVEHLEVIQGVKVIYTAQGETADTLIEKLAKELSKNGTVFVATSDWAEQRMILGQGAYRITPKELSKRIKQAEQQQNHYLPKPPVDDYLEDRLAGEMRDVLEKWRREKG